MTITSQLFEAYIKCPTKCFLKGRGEVGTGNAYAGWVREQNVLYRSEGTKRMTRGNVCECINGTSEAVKLKSPHWHLAVDFIARADNLESTIDLVERLPSQEGGGPAQFIPIRFIHRDKLTRDDRLLLAFDAFVLSGTLERDVGLGRIICGEEYVTHQVKASERCKPSRFERIPFIFADACSFLTPRPRCIWISRDFPVANLIT
jgi:hypothetical protein